MLASSKNELSTSGWLRITGSSFEELLNGLGVVEVLVLFLLKEVPAPKLGFMSVFRSRSSVGKCDSWSSFFSKLFLPKVG